MKKYKTVLCPKEPRNSLIFFSYNFSFRHISNTYWLRDHESESWVKKWAWIRFMASGSVMGFIKELFILKPEKIDTRTENVWYEWSCMHETKMIYDFVVSCFVKRSLGLDLAYVKDNSCSNYLTTIWQCLKQIDECTPSIIHCYIRR